ncbi:ABC transporter ATP-binding protein [Desulfatiferula olefinivorans]
MIIVNAESVVKTYVQGSQTVRALSAVDLSVRRGEFLALAGPSGSGKTTLLNLIGGLDTPDSGTVTVDGRELCRLSGSELARLRLHRIGFVFQSYNLIPVLSAEENVAYIMQLQGVPSRERRDRARQVLDEVGLSGLYGRRPAQLSGGQQQRVAVARAIAADPAIVLADEPTANLDSKTGESLLDLMQHLNTDKGVTFVFSTHDRMVMDHAHRLVMIRDGRIVDDVTKG